MPRNNREYDEKTQCISIEYKSAIHHVQPQMSIKTKNKRTNNSSFKFVKLLSVWCTLFFCMNGVSVKTKQKYTLFYVVYCLNRNESPNLTFKLWINHTMQELSPSKCYVHLLVVRKNYLCWYIQFNQFFLRSIDGLSIWKEKLAFASMVWNKCLIKCVCKQENSCFSIKIMFLHYWTNTGHFS